MSDTKMTPTHHLQKSVEDFKEEYRKAYTGILSEEVLSEGNAWFESFLLSKLREAYLIAEEKTKMDVAHAFGEYWPISGDDLNNLPKLAKEMRDGLLKIAADEVEKGHPVPIQFDFSKYHEGGVEYQRGKHHGAVEALTDAANRLRDIV